MFLIFLLVERYNLKLTRGIDNVFGLYHVNGTIIETAHNSSASSSRITIGDEIVAINGNNVSGHKNFQRMFVEISGIKSVVLTMLHFPGIISFV